MSRVRTIVFFVAAILSAAFGHRHPVATFLSRPVSTRIISRCKNRDPRLAYSVAGVDADVVAEVERQLGYVPPNLVAVTSRTVRRNSPVALRTYPLNGGTIRRRSRSQGKLTPFPTLYWLSDPNICRAVADLERRGNVALLEKRLRLDPAYVKLHLAAHEDYARERWESLTVDDRAMLEDALTGKGEVGGITAGMVEMIRSSGIAGRSRPFGPSIKCLHCHYAHYRSGGEDNIVGRWIDELLREEFPDLDL